MLYIVNTVITTALALVWVRSNFANLAIKLTLLTVAGWNIVETLMHFGYMVKV